MPVSPQHVTHAGTGDHNDFDFDRIFGVGDHSGSEKKQGLNTSVEDLFSNPHSANKHGHGSAQQHQQQHVDNSTAASSKEVEGRSTTSGSSKEVQS